MGPLYGTFFTDMADSLAGADALDRARCAAMLHAGLDAVCGLGDAKPGDKTLVDVLAARRRGLRRRGGRGEGFAACLDAMKAAAAAGCEATRGMVARLGRAARLGERSRGHLDAGAASCDLLLRTLADGLRARLAGAPREGRLDLGRALRRLPLPAGLRQPRGLRGALRRAGLHRRLHRTLRRDELPPRRRPGLPGRARRERPRVPRLLVPHRPRARRRRRGVQGPDGLRRRPRRCRDQHQRGRAEPAGPLPATTSGRSPSTRRRSASSSAWRTPATARTTS